MEALGATVDLPSSDLVGRALFVLRIVETLCPDGSGRGQAPDAVSAMCFSDRIGSSKEIGEESYGTSTTKAP